MLPAGVGAGMAGCAACAPVCGAARVDRALAYPSRRDRCHRSWSGAGGLSGKDFSRAGDPVHFHMLPARASSGGISCRRSRPGVSNCSALMELIRSWRACGASWRNAATRWERLRDATCAGGRHPVPVNMMTCWSRRQWRWCWMVSRGAAPGGATIIPRRDPLEERGGF